MKSAPNSGWTAIEVTIASALMLLVFAKGAFVMKSARSAIHEQSASLHLDDQAQLTMERLALAIMGSARGTLLPSIDEVHCQGVKYRFNLGIEDGEIVWSDQEEIKLETGTKVVWSSKPGAADERRAVWVNTVRPFLEGEVLNGVDDNQNGLVDESGLSFVLDGNSVVIRLTLQRTNENGKAVTRSIERVVTCRN